MSKHYAIKCTNCAAPLSILGGGRVSTVTCSYCHSVLDMNDHYKVLTRFTNAKTLVGDFQIGMRGNIKGVEWTIIGWVAYHTAALDDERWEEFFLYSPTHGYAWLFEENGKLYFSKKVRDFDLLLWQKKEPRTLFYHKGHYLQKEASYLTYIEYVEGELNWIAKFGDKFTTWDYEGVGFQSLSIEKNGEEIEVYHTQQLKKSDIYHAFGLEYSPKSQNRKTIEKKSIERLQEETSSTLEEEDQKIKYGFWALFLLLSLFSIFSLFSDNIVYKTDYSKDINQTFTIDKNTFLTSIHLKVKGNGTANNRLWLYHEGKEVFYIDSQTVRSIHNTLLNPWDRDAIGATIYLKLEKGNYIILAKKDTNSLVTTLTIKQHVIRLKYIIPLLLIVVLILLSPYFYLLNGSLGFILYSIVGGVILYLLFGIFWTLGILFFLFTVADGYKKKDSDV